MMRRYLLAVVAGLFLVLAASQTSLAAKDDKYPSKTITWLINAAPGGGFDLHSRAVARVMRKKLGVNIIIRNVPGAGGVISWNLLTVAKPDGYTIGIVNLPGAIVSQLFKETQYKLREFSWIGRISAAPYIYAAGKQYGLRTLEDFRKRKEVLITESGYGTTGWVNSALTAATMGFKPKFIMGYAGAPASNMAIVRGEGHARALGLDSPGQMAFIKDGSMVPTWVYLDKRDPRHPDVPTVGELGFPQLSVLAANRVVAAPPKMPKDRMAVLIKAFRESIEDPETQAAFKSMRAKTSGVYGDDWLPVMETMFKLIQDNADVFKKVLK
ncbi:MAG: tripartite tricarboxylate transporter substrate binding protein [Deltaproteobacteria bacterium]|nr:tripartite tricarboxylate transporter substrate binding protein [Deltaproteobacteria bacterium]